VLETSYSFVYLYNNNNQVENKDRRLCWQTAGNTGCSLGCKTSRYAWVCRVVTTIAIQEQFNVIDDRKA